MIACNVKAVDPVIEREREVTDIPVFQRCICFKP